MTKGHALLFESVPSAEPLAVIGSPVLSLRLRSARDQDGVAKVGCLSWQPVENGSKRGGFMCFQDDGCLYKTSPGINENNWR